MKHFNKLIATLLALTIAIALLCSACAPGNTVALAETPEPTPTATATQTPTPCPTPTATPTIKPIPDLTDEEAKRQIDLLVMMVDPRAELPLSRICLVFSSRLSENGDKNYFVEFVYLGIKDRTNTMVLTRIWNEKKIYEFPQNGTDTTESLLDGVIASPLYGSLNGFEVEKITPFCNLEVYCKTFNIRTKRIDTSIGEEIWESQGVYISQLSFSFLEIGDFYVRTFAKGNRMSAADYTDPIPYTPRTPAP